MTAGVAVAIDRMKHSAQRTWTAGRLTVDERFESNLTAVEPVTGEVKKNVHLRYPNHSGTLVTGGGLVFLGLLDGTVAAFDDTTLDELWKINIGSGFAAPPMTFEIDGKQYVAITSGPSAVSNHTEEHAGAQRYGALRVRTISGAVTPETSSLNRNPTNVLSHGGLKRRRQGDRCRSAYVFVA
jgi:glucose dehydrogenase